MSGAIRRAAAADALALSALHRRTRQAAWPFIVDPNTPEDDLRLFSETVLARCTVWTAEEAGTLRGFCAVRTGWIDHLFVAPEAQGKGWGGRLLAAALARRRRVRLWTLQRNIRARAFYRTHGFSEVRFTEGRVSGGRQPDVMLEWRAGPTG